MEANPAPSPVRIAIAVVEHEGRFLIGQRQPGAPLAGMWEFPGGKIEAGESPQAAAARECFEETGLTVAVGEPYEEVSHHYEHADVRLYFFACRPLGAWEHVPPRFRWVSARDLAEYPFPAANAALIEYLSRGAARRSASPPACLPFD